MSTAAAAKPTSHQQCLALALISNISLQIVIYVFDGGLSGPTTRQIFDESAVRAQRAATRPLYGASILSSIQNHKVAVAETSVCTNIAIGSEIGSE